MLGMQDIISLEVTLVHAILARVIHGWLYRNWITFTSTGEQTVDLNFDGGSIYEKGANASIGLYPGIDETNDFLIQLMHKLVNIHLINLCRTSRIMLGLWASNRCFWKSS